MEKSELKPLIIIPTFNEKANIETLIETISGFNLGLSVLVVDDNSPDGTGIIADRLSKKYNWVFVLHRPGKQGLGTAYIEGFHYAIKKSFDLIFTMDADFSHDPKYINDFLNNISDCDFVLGSRYMKGISVVNWPLRRVILSIFANNYVKYITGMPFADCTSGFSCFRRGRLEEIDIDKIASQGYSFLVELKYLFFKKRFKMKEIPIIFVERRKGDTKMSLKVMCEAAITPWRLRFFVH